MSKNPVLIGISALIAASLTFPVLAQDDADNAAGILEEVIVTAAKREQTLQQVPIAVTVVSAEVMRRAQIHDIKDLQSLVPSLRVTQLQLTGNTNFVIRGFGNGANNAGIEPSVGVFIDGVYRSRSASAMADLPNLERIEVLRGPQSTLFGKNASAGVISVITAKPDMNDFGGSASFTIGDYSQFIAKADVSGPLSDTAAFSLSGSVNQRDGYYINLENGSDINEHGRWGLRGQLLFQPSDELEIRFIADIDEIDEACCGVGNLLNGPTGGIIQLIGGNLVPEAPFSRDQYYDFDPVNEIQNSGLSLQVDYDMDGATFTSITAFRNQSRFENADVDFTSARLISTNSSDTEIDTFTQEFRLTSSGQGDIDWMIGGFYFDEEVEVDNILTYGQDFRAYGNVLTGGQLGPLEAALGIPAGTFFAPGQGRFESFGQDNQALSLFGQVDFHMMDDRMTLTLGANYTKDEKDTFANMLVTDVFSALDFVQIGAAFIFNALTGLPPTPANFALAPAAAGAALALSTVPCSPTTGPACNSLLAFQPLQFMPQFLNFPNSVEPGSSEDDDVTWTVRLAYEATDNVNIYIGAATGFKATSWNLSRDSRPFESDLAAINAAGLGLPNLNASTRYAGPEEATVYEIGLKARFDRANVNIAIFDQSIDGFQSNVFLGTGFFLINAGKQSTSGVELEVNFAATDALQISFAGTWLDPKYDSFVQAAGVFGIVDLSGTTVPGVHEFSMNLSTNYSFDFGDDGSGFVRLEYIYDDLIPIIENVPASIASREVKTWNASLGFQWGDGYEALLWGRNLNNDDYLLSAFPSVAQAGSFSGYPNEPRTYGLTISKYF